MPILKKLISLGKSSKAIVIPNEWLDYYEKQGIPIDSLIMEVNNIITLRILNPNEIAMIEKLDESEKPDRVATESPREG